MDKINLYPTALPWAFVCGVMESEAYQGSTFGGGRGVFPIEPKALRVSCQTDEGSLYPSMSGREK